MANPTITITATDLSPISGIGEAEDAWLRQIAKRAKADELALRLSKSDVDDKPIVSFDARSGNWWTGRHVGEIAFQDGTLHVLPRFGVPQLQRWLSRIWGVRILSSKGKYEASRLWLWELLAKLWEARLLSAAKHGLPTSRVEELHRGPTVRGRVDVRSTAKELGTGRRNLISRTRNRSIDRDIASVVLCAFENLRNQLQHLGSHRSWLTQRSQNLVDGLQGQYARRVSVSSVEVRKPIRYTPITEGYRPVVDLSLSIMRQRPMSSTTGGQSDVLGVLIDMAEVWEMYVYQLLRANLIEADVVHAGRKAENETHLLKSTVSGCVLGGLKPDILIRPFGSNRLLAVVDAKYKSTTRHNDRPSGVHREDLYQMSAYLSAVGDRNVPMAGALVYPRGTEASVISEFQGSSPWSISRIESSFWFLGVDCVPGDAGADGLTVGEAEFVERVRGMIASTRVSRPVLVQP